MTVQDFTLVAAADASGLPAEPFAATHLGGEEVTGRFRADVGVHPGQTFPFAIDMQKPVAFDPKTELRIV